MYKIRATINGSEKEVDAGTPVSAIMEEALDSDGLPHLAALVNNDVCSLSYNLTVNCDVELITAANSLGWRVYRNSLCFLLAKAIADLFPEAMFSVEHSFGLGLYCSFHKDADDDGISEDDLNAIKSKMMDYVREDISIERHKLSYSDAVNRFTASGQTDKLNLLRYHNQPNIVVHWCDGFSDLAHGPLAPSTGTLANFDLIHYKPGFVLHLAERKDPQVIPPFKDMPHLFNVFQEHKSWGRKLHVDTVGCLNELIGKKDIEDFIAACEALHEKKISAIAEQTAILRDNVKLIMIAGPSCAGKTTFAKRLATHLHVNGLRTDTISVDDYFVGSERNPVDENGDPDYEHLEAVDLELFNSDLVKLIDGEEINLPSFNFKIQQREYEGRKMQIKENEVLLIEGIHCLNPRLTELIDEKYKFKIYISALTQLNLDNNNRISTTDNRLMRRIIRDNFYRGHSAHETLQLWNNVRRGEKRWIFPFQQKADVTFNSALDYELSVIKPIAEPLLMQIKPSHEEYAEARRLSEFLSNFLATSGMCVPLDSILREYIGGSSFRY